MQDARLVVLNALDAAERGAQILTRTRVMSAERGARHWDVVLRSKLTGTQRSVESALHRQCHAGRGSPRCCARSLHVEPSRHLRMAKGSHIVVRRLFAHDYAYILQNRDKRVIFAIPFEGDFTLIGTTDVQYEGDPASAAIVDEEVDYLCEAVNGYFARAVTPADVVWSYSGVRPLLEDESDVLSEVTRDYKLELDAPENNAPLLSVFGGKITTYRRLAEEAMAAPAKAVGTISSRPGPQRRRCRAATCRARDFGRFLEELKRRHPWLPAALAERYAHAYGTRAERLLADAKSLADLGADIGEGLHEAEINYLTFYEWALTANDVLWRRSKLGLHVSPATADAPDRVAGRARHRARFQRGTAMRLTLQNVTKVVRGADPPARHRSRPRLRLVQRAARPDAGGQDLAAAADGGARPPDQRRNPGRRQRRHRPRRAQAQRGDGLSGIRQLPELHRLSEHRFAPAARRAAVREPRSTPRSKRRRR